MEREDMISVPYIVHEGVQVRLERIIKRLAIALVLAILLIFASNALWLYAWMQYDYQGEDETVITKTIDVNGHNGTANYISGSGRIINGTSDGYGNNTEEANETKD